MAFDQPYVPNINNALSNAAPAYALGATMRQENAMSQAGKSYAQGNTRGAINQLSEAGLMDKAMALEDRLKAAAKEANDAQLAKAQRTNELLGNLALRADTPEKWTAAFQAAKQAGLDVDQWEDFGTRDFVLAQAGKSKAAIDAELAARKAGGENKPIEINGRLVQRQPDGTFKEVYTAPPKPEGLTTVAPGSTVFDPNTRAPLYTAPDKPQSLQSVSPGTTLYDPNNRKPVYTAPAAQSNQFKVVGKGGRVFDEQTQQFIEPPGGTADPVEGAKFEQDLRKEYAALSKNFRSVQEGVDRVKAGARLDNAVGDLSLIFGYMKLLDPGSVVREGEFANAEMAQGVPDRVLNWYNKIVSGDRLTPNMRQEFAAAAKELGKSQIERQQRIMDQFRGIATDAGVDPERIIMDFGPQQETPPPAGAPDSNNQIPKEAIDMLRSDPSPEAVQEFDEVFGPGSAQRVFGR